MKLYYGDVEAPRPTHRATPHQDRLNRASLVRDGTLRVTRAPPACNQEDQAPHAGSPRRGRDFFPAHGVGRMDYFSWVHGAPLLPAGGITLTPAAARRCRRAPSKSQAARPAQQPVQVAPAGGGARGYPLARGGWTTLLDWRSKPSRPSPWGCAALSASSLQLFQWTHSSPFRSCFRRRAWLRKNCHSLLGVYAGRGV